MTHFHLGPHALSRHVAACYQGAYLRDPATCDLLFNSAYLPRRDRSANHMNQPLTYPGISGIVEEDKMKTYNTVKTTNADNATNVMSGYDPNHVNFSEDYYFMTHLDPRFTPALIAMAQASHHKFYPRGPFVSITLAQWAVESGYGAHMSGVNNCFGIKARPGQDGRDVITKEYFKGQWFTVTQRFANYQSLEECFDAHAELLTTEHYAACMAAHTPQDYALALHTCGYATAPNYPQVLMGVINANGLAQFDERF